MQRYCPDSRALNESTEILNYASLYYLSDHYPLLSLHLSSPHPRSPRPWRVTVYTFNDTLGPTLFLPHLIATVLYSTGVSARRFPLAKLFFQKFDYTPHMCNWFPCHVPSSRWQVINSAALTKCSHRALVFCVSTVCSRTLLGRSKSFFPPLSVSLSLPLLLFFLSKSRCHV